MNKLIKKYLKEDLLKDIEIYDEYLFWTSLIDEKEEFYEMIENIEPFKSDRILLSKCILKFTDSKNKTKAFESIWKYRLKWLKRNLLINEYDLESKKIWNYISNIK